MAGDTKFDTLKIAASAITGVVAILGGVWALDSHYATAAEVQAMQRSLQAQVVQLRGDQLEDKIFELDVKQKSGQKLSPVEAAMYDRYMRQVKETRSLQRNLEIDDAKK